MFQHTGEKLYYKKRNFFIRLRNCGYKKVFLAGSENYWETGNNGSDTSPVNDTERIFQMTFSE